ncbi:MotA/TolQ/ExbB proton channel family protein [Caldanaerobius fijiensis DSM 17918]|uniref:MotA/TolQ/ExbB proton channel family protein n=1 Tax=Caldanaerobius fijiensis DSM 17918 TaxID=1121256 RepID=A0A1M5BPX2_9THEO|nr:MotA/TolQ/ExbB proton channel family protein [Caldanaerobius fijiensis]SHF44584.1 MotA/TolQ/ExbB proton channel family protein [Caldanaerobius fijiensis DSM 17918]
MNFKEITLFIIRVIPGFTNKFCWGILLIALITLVFTHRKPWQYIRIIDKYMKKIHNTSDKDMLLEELIELTDEIIEKKKNDKYVTGLLEKFKNRCYSGNIKNAVDVLDYTALVEIPGERKIFDMMPGVFTGLGILGTFMGLVQGLSDLNFSGSTQALEQGINNLISGMYLAFLTSIAGLVSSLGWSLVDRGLIHYYRRKIDSFHSSYKKVFAQKEIDDYLKDIREIQEEQKTYMQKFVSDFSLELSNVLSNMLEQRIFPEFANIINQQVTSKIVESFDNTIGEIKQSTESSKQMIERFANLAYDNQLEGVQKIVNKFIESMDLSLKGKFADLGESIGEMIKWQQMVKEGMNELIEKLSNNILNLQDVNRAIENIITNFSDYFDKINTANNHMVENISKLESVSSNINGLIEDMSKMIRDINEQKDLLLKDKTEHIQIISRYISEINEKFGLLEKSYANISKDIDILNNSLKQSMEEFANKTHEGLKRSLSLFDEELASITSYLNSTLSEIEEAVDELPKVIIEFKKTLRNNEKEMQTIEG